MATYNRFSPYQATNQTRYFDHYTPVTLKPASDDTYYVIPDKYHHQPWRLAKDLYGQERLHYVFALLNMNTIKDPLYDFKAGTLIRIPSAARVQKMMEGRYCQILGTIIPKKIPTRKKSLILLRILMISLIRMKTSC